MIAAILVLYFLHAGALLWYCTYAENSKIPWLWWLAADPPLTSFVTEKAIRVRLGHYWPFKPGSRIRLPLGETRLYLVGLVPYRAGAYATTTLARYLIARSIYVAQRQLGAFLWFPVDVCYSVASLRLPTKLTLLIRRWRT